MDPVNDTAYSEPGALDNRLSLDPNDPRWGEKISEWENGQEYTIQIRVRQVSPGEFEVVGMKGSGAVNYAGQAAMDEEEEIETEEEAPMSQEAEAANPRVNRGIVNPAVQALIGARQRGNGTK